jgi:hypothetical protein
MSLFCKGFKGKNLYCLIWHFWSFPYSWDDLYELWTQRNSMGKTLKAFSVYAAQTAGGGGRTDPLLTFLNPRECSMNPHPPAMFEYSGRYIHLIQYYDIAQVHFWNWVGWAWQVPGLPWSCRERAGTPRPWAGTAWPWTGTAGPRTGTAGPRASRAWTRAGWHRVLPASAW